MQAVGTQIGVGLASAIRHVVVWLNTMMKYVLKAATMFANFMQTIFGKYKGGASGIAMEGLGDAADYADDLGGAADNAASGLGDAADSAQQLKKDLSVLPLDELNQLNKDRETTSSGSGTGGAGVGGLGTGGITDGLLDWDDELEETLEGSALRAKINAWATQLKKDFLMHDWEGLGADLADGLNRGLQKVYDLLDPEEFKKKVDPWINAATTTFNSFVEHFDFELLGKTFGRGINDFVHVANETLEGIDWRNLGSKLASGANGFMEEVDFTEVGHLIGNKFMVFWNTLNGFVHDFHWDELGTSIANTINGLNEKLDLSVVADTLATGTNGVFTALGTLADETHWNEIATNIANGIVTFIDTMEWEKNAENLKNFITKLCEAITNAVDDVGPEKWEELGQGIATMLAGVPWAKVLKTVGHVIVVALGGILKGLFSEPEGTLAAAVIFGLGMLKFKHSSFGKFAGNLATALTGDTLSGHIKTAFKKLFKKSVTEATEDSTVTTAAEAAGKSTAKSWATGWSKFLSSGAGTALLEVGAIGATLIAAKEFSEYWDKKRGGNGMLTDMGTGIEDWVNKMAEAKVITKEQQDALFALKEEQENYGTSTEEVAQMVIDKINEWNGDTAAANEVAQKMISTGQGMNNEYQKIAGVTATAGDQLKVLAGDIDMTNASAQQAKNDIHNAVFELSQMSSGAEDLSGKYQYVLDAFDQTQGSATTAQGAYEMVKKHLEDVGLSADDLNKILGEKYPEVAQTVDTTSKDIGDHMTGLSKVSEMASSGVTNAIEMMRSGMRAKTIEMAGHVSNFASSVGRSVMQTVMDFATGGSASSKYQTDVSQNMTNTANAVSNYQSDAQRSLNDTESDFSKASGGSVSSMIKMGGQTALLLLAVKAMSSGSKSSVEDMSDAFSTAFDSIKEGFSSIKSGLSESFNGLADIVDQQMWAIKRVLLSQNLEMWRAGQDMGQSLANGFSSVHIPMPHMYVAWWQQVNFGDGGYMFYPEFGLQWYRKGGLFQGGKGQMIGIAEDGRDEAVLPLEDRRAMAKIGSAIADAGGSSGGQDEFVDKVANRLAEIIMMHQDNEQAPIFNIEVKTESDEVLARAVSRGQRRLDYRNNPTPRMAY